MHRLAIVGAGLLSIAGFAGTASAADLPARTYTKAPPIVAPIYNWGGFYIGLNGGGGSSHNCWDGGIPVPTGLGCHDATGGLVGGQIGYRWQAANWVFGLEAQGDWANLKASNTSAVGTFGGSPFLNQTKIDSIGLFTGQVGYAWNSALLYVKGGAAVVSDNYSGRVTATDVAFDRAKETRWGATVGVGLEYGFTPNWSVAAEYDHLFMGDRTNTFTSVIAPGALSRFDRVNQDVDLITARINYRFGGPVVARY